MNFNYFSGSSLLNIIEVENVCGHGVFIVCEGGVDGKFSFF